VEESQGHGRVGTSEDPCPEGPWYCYLWKYVADENMPKIDITMNTDIVPLKMVVSGQVLTADVGEGSTQEVLFISRYGVYTAYN
jgi:hypothetical protein